MSKIKINKSVNIKNKIWRYFSIEKLIYLLENKKLYFVPLSKFTELDPFEGYMPAVAVEATSSIYKKLYKELENTYLQLKTNYNSESTNYLNKEKTKKLLLELEIKLKNFKKSPKELFKIINKGICVNCWHINEHESEAMWRIYSENGKGLAIQTTVELLDSALNNNGDDTYIQIGNVKYLDFFDKKLTPKDCLIDGNLAPLLKRISYKHEEELRVFIVPKFDLDKISSYNQNPIIIPVDISKLIQKIYISPFADDLFISTIFSICEKYKINPSLIYPSNLLKGLDDLLNIFD